MARPKPLAVDVPSPTQDQPQLGRVGLIAAAGFAIGVVWPWLAGVKLVPTPPAEELAPVAIEEDPAPVASAAPTPASPAEKVGPAEKAAEPAAPAARRAQVGPATITSCRDEAGRQQPACDPIPIDAVITPKLEAIAGCPAAAEARGTLSLGFKLDFGTGKISGLNQGKSTTLPKAVASGLLGCAESQLATASFANVPHSHASYTVFYLVELTQPADDVTDDEARDAKPGGDITPATGTATVAWVAARIRKEPQKDGAEVARLLEGTRVKVVGKKGDWYQIVYDAKGSRGWVFKSAIGM